MDTEESTAVDVAFQLIGPSFNAARAGVAAIERRIEHQATFTLMFLGISIGVILSTGDMNSWHHYLLLALTLSLPGIAVVLGYRARKKGPLKEINPQKFLERQEKRDEDPKRAAVVAAGTALKINADLIAEKAKQANRMASLIFAGVLFEMGLALALFVC